MSKTWFAGINITAFASLKVPNVHDIYILKYMIHIVFYYISDSIKNS